MNRQISKRIARTLANGIAPLVVTCGIISPVALTRPAGGASVPNPRVTGPVAARVAPGDASHEYPFFSSIGSVTPYGYVEEEFFLEGAANRYSTPPWPRPRS